MGRLARQLADGGTYRHTPRALLLVDEVGALGHQARHLRGLVGRARESGLAVVLATQGPSDLEAVDRALLPQVLQDTAWQLAFRQGSPQDAERMQALFGHSGTRWPSDQRYRRVVDGSLSPRYCRVRTANQAPPVRCSYGLTAGPASCGRRRGWSRRCRPDSPP